MCAIGEGEPAERPVQTIQALKNRDDTHTELFKKRVYNDLKGLNASSAVRPLSAHDAGRFVLITPVNTQYWLHALRDVSYQQWATVKR